MFVEPVTVKLPDIIALPVNGKGDTYPDRYDAVRAKDADVACDELIDVLAKELLVAKDELIALLAQDEVPIRFPVKLPEKDPVRFAFICFPCINFNAIVS